MTNPCWKQTSFDGDLSNYKSQFEVCLRHDMVLWLYWEYGTIIFVSIEASTAPSVALELDATEGLEPEHQ